MNPAPGTRNLRAGGFSLIELLIVVAIILVLAALAIPNFMRSKMAANESAAVAALRTIATVQVTYQSSYQQGFAPSLEALGPPPAGTQPSAAAAGLIDPVLASRVKSGYLFSYTPIDTDSDNRPDAYTLHASPSSPGTTGEKYFYVDQTNVIRWNRGAQASSTSQPIPPG
jgi:prepilin-type N-terminal cleavage/methylation domain-containing protein